MLLDDLSDTPSGPSPRHRTVQVRVGDGACAVLVGGGAPIVVQSMTNTDTADIEGTVQQVADLARAGSELVRITVDRDEAAAAVPHIRDRLAKLGVGVPLVARHGRVKLAEPVKVEIAPGGRSVTATRVTVIPLADARTRRRRASARRAAPTTGGRPYFRARIVSACAWRPPICLEVL
jgi:hypothetical protein